jgi:hypothetical protein
MISLLAILTMAACSVSIGLSLLVLRLLERIQILEKELTKALQVCWTYAPETKARSERA